MTPGLLQPAGAELFVYGDARVGGEASPLTPARYPNAVQGGPTVAWASLFGVNYTAAPGISARLEMDPAAAARSGLWAQQLQQDPGSVRAKYIGELGWLEHTQALVAVGASSPPSPQPPPTCADTVENYGIMGSDLAGTPTNNVGDAGECCALCSARTNCRFWSYSPSLTRCYQKYQNASGAWQRNPGVVSGQSTTPHASVAVTLGAQCVSIQAEDTYGDGAVVLISNALAELDTPGEYYINRTSGMAYAWLPGLPEEWPSVSPWGSPWVPSAAAPGGAFFGAAATAAAAGGKSPAGAVGDRDPSLLGYVSAAPHALVLEGVSFLTLDGLTIEGAQDAAVVARNCTRVTLSNALLQNAGNMVVNVTKGEGVTLVSCTVRGGANGGVLMEGGDRPTLTRGGHTLLNSTTSYSSRLVWLNAPMVSLDGVGHGLVGSEIYGGPHMGGYYSGNDHRIEGNHFHEVVQACDDAGALYGGRDWAYQGTVISRNTFSNLHSSEGLDVSAVYLDDMISGVRVENNLFVNVSRAVLLGGGRWNTISGNSIHGVSQSNDAAVHFDNRGMGWSNSGCNVTPAYPSPNMVTLLNRVPYSTSPVWRTRFPALVGILEDYPCMPKYNSVVNNTYCGLEGGIPFLDVPDAAIEAWGSVVGGNVNNESACAAAAGDLQRL